MNQYDYVEAGLKVFGIHPSKGDVCGCGDENCKAAFKHPAASNWQHSPHWSDEQLEVMEEMGVFSTGFGVLVDDLLVVDVDARNGGVESFDSLCKDLGIDLLGESGFAVLTGSGNGSMHLYFKRDTAALKQHHEKYKGIDFKSSGYVIGAGSLHKSGMEYEVLHGSPADIDDAPEALLSILKKPDTYRAHTSRGVVDITQKECADVLAHISPDADYDTWIRCGMAIHHTFDGDGLELWDEWSQRGDKYPGFEQVQRHWHSFGKCTTPVQYGTLIHYAEEAGYQQPVTFEYVDDNQAPTAAPMVDLKRPPGLVGEIAQWINSSARYKRESLAVAAALQAVGNIAGLKYVDARDGMTANIISFCVAGSSTGKEHVQQCFSECLREAGLIDAMHGAIKSEQEIVRNLTRHQAAFYSIDEFGLVLRKIMGPRSASYLEGVIGLVMSTYSKADAFLPVSGDVKESLRAELRNELAACQKRIDDNEDKSGAAERRIPQVQRALDNIANGIEAPFLSIIGYTTPVTFNSLIDFETATNGFLSRAMIFDEPENNPKPNRKRTGRAMPKNLAAQLQQLYAMGEYDVIGDGRIEHYGDKKAITTAQDAQERLDDIIDEFWNLAEDSKDNGLEAIPRRGYELCAKVSFVLAIPEGVRTLEHVEWAYALAKADCERKMRLALSNITQEDAPTDSIAVKVQDILENSEEGETQGVICNRCRPHKKDEVCKVLDALVERGLIKTIEREHPKNKKRFKKYVIA